MRVQIRSAGAISTILPRYITAIVVGDVPHHREVVRDEEVREAEPVLQVFEQVHDAGLDRHVERGDRLVEHEHRRVERERTRDADALALTAGELVRVAVAVLGVQPDEREQLAHPLRRDRRGTLWIIERLGDRSTPTVMRGSSDAYGSWNTICISRRSAAQLALAERGELGALGTSPSPTSARCSRSTHRPTVDLPEPDSPTRPSVCPAPIENDTPDTACTVRFTVRAPCELRTGKFFTRSLDLEDGRRARRPRCGRLLDDRAHRPSPSGP